MSYTRPIPALGVIFHPRFPPESLADYARQAEAAGFDELWLWDDCFLPGALTSASIALAATKTLKVGIGLLPATAYHPLFAAMELTTLARAFPQRILPGFGHGVGPWMDQIGAASKSKSSLKTLEETVTAVRQLLGGDMVNMSGQQVHLEQVQMQLTSDYIPPIYLGAMREKSLRLAGRMGEGTILTGMSSPAYVRWACEHIHAGMDEVGRTENRVAVYFDVKVNEDGESARNAVRHSLARRLPWADVHVEAQGITHEVEALMQKQDVDDIARSIPDEWVDAFSASGTPEQATSTIGKLFDAGADTVIFQPLDGDSTCLDEYARLLMPLLKR